MILSILLGVEQSLSLLTVSLGTDNELNKLNGMK